MTIMKGMTVFLTVAASCIFLSLARAQNAPENQKPNIVGQWQAANQSVEIFEGGKILLNNQLKNERSEGSYTLIKSNVIRLKLQGSQPEDFNLSLSGDKLTLTRANGEIFAVYKRIKPIE
jgi:hypothetical protein